MNSQNMVVMIIIVSFSALGSSLIIQSVSAQDRPDFCQLVPKACVMVPYCKLHPLACLKFEKPKDFPVIIVIPPPKCPDCPEHKILDLKSNESIILTGINETAGINETNFAVKLPTEDVLRMLGNISSMK